MHIHTLSLAESTPHNTHTAHTHTHTGEEGRLGHLLTEHSLTTMDAASHPSPGWAVRQCADLPEGTGLDQNFI